jgi:hypothetical protein
VGPYVHQGNDQERFSALEAQQHHEDVSLGPGESRSISIIALARISNKRKPDQVEIASESNEIAWEKFITGFVHPRQFLSSEKLLWKRTIFDMLLTL